MTDNIAVNAGKELYAAVLEAQRSLKSLRKDAHNAFANYDYTSSEAMLQASRDALHAAGLVAFRGAWEYTRCEGAIWDVRMEMTVAHPSSGQKFSEWISWPAVEGKGKPMDKAVATALTTALSYWLRDLLAIPRNAGDDMDERDDRDAEPSTSHKPKEEPKPRSHAELISTMASRIKTYKTWEDLIGKVMIKVDELFTAEPDPSKRLTPEECRQLTWEVAQQGVKVAEDPSVVIAWATMKMKTGFLTNVQVTKLATIAKDNT